MALFGSRCANWLQLEPSPSPKKLRCAGMLREVLEKSSATKAQEMEMEWSSHSFPSCLVSYLDNLIYTYAYIHTYTYIYICIDTSLVKVTKCHLQWWWNHRSIVEWFSGHRDISQGIHGGEWNGDLLQPTQGHCWSSPWKLGREWWHFGI